MNTAQRTVVSIALALALVVLGLWVDGAGSAAPIGGWYNTAPNAGVVYTFDVSWLQGHPFVRMLFWLGVVAVWAGVSLVLFRTRRRVESHPDERSAQLTD